MVNQMKSIGTLIRHAAQQLPASIGPLAVTMIQPASVLC